VAIASSPTGTEAELTAAQNAFTAEVTKLSEQIQKDQTAATKVKTDKKL
jgi:hypothetical protein